MNKEETIKIMALLKATYPNYYKDFGKQELQGILNIWQEMFADYSYEIVGTAIKSLIANDDKGFPPVIGQVMKHIIKMTQPEQLTKQEAWNLIKDACKYYKAKEEFDKLPPILQRIVGSYTKLREWAVMDLNQLDTVVASNVMKSYEAIALKEKEFKTLPSALKEHYLQINSAWDIKNVIPDKLSDGEFVKKRDNASMLLEGLK